MAGPDATVSKNHKPRELWRPPNPEATGMWAFMRAVERRREVQFKVIGCTLFILEACCFFL